MSAPIEPAPFVSGVTVVDIGDLRVARGLTRRPVAVCKHLRMTYDPRERRVWCQDCETDVDSFDAFMEIVERYASATKHLERRANEVREAEAFAIRSRAAKVMDEAWRRRSVVPTCPHCRAGLLPEDILKKGLSVVSTEYEQARRRRTAQREG